MTTSTLSAVVGLLFASLAVGQSSSVEERRGSRAPEAFSGSVPLESADDAVLSLTLAEAIRRGLDRNLGVLLSSAALEGAEGERRQSRSALLPHLGATVGESRRKINLSVFGFPPSADRPSVVGPFEVFDARLLLEWTLYDAGQHLGHRSFAMTERYAHLSPDHMKKVAELTIPPTSITPFITRAGKGSR